VGLWGRGKAPYTLYRLPRVAEAVAAGERVFLVEGEKDADALERAGAVATTAPGGAGKVWRPEYTEALRAPM
jgi:DNA primase